MQVDLIIHSTLSFHGFKTKMIIKFTLLLLVGLAAASPITADDDTILVTKEYFPDMLIKYKSKHDIVNIFLPMNYMNDIDDESDVDNIQLPFFFIEADVHANDKRVDKGLYIFKDNKATKLLENGRDVAANDDTPTQVFFGASDGIYVYKEDTKEAVKYGSVSDSIIGIAKPTYGDAIYILTEEHELFNVTEAGTKKIKVNEVVGAKQIMLDYSNNLYFYAEDKQPYVLTPEGVKKIEGLPAHPKSINLIRPPIVLTDGVPVVIDNAMYFIHESGSSEASGLVFKPKAKPTAYSMETVLFQHYAYNKNIYEYNILALLETVLSGELKDLIDENTTNIQSLATKTKEKKSSKRKHA
ncbi:uncharacterized protein [Epargyreus clarus]|uniref:uncharacterized protein n=1 Tax=Epargyreus clarus TaxID=520877 RepID=UPI003C2B74DF